MPRHFVLSILLIVSTHATVINFDNTLNTSPKFQCNYTQWDDFYSSPPDEWGPILRRNSFLYPTTAPPPECRHCWWNLGYPPANPFAFVVGLNCSQFNFELYLNSKLPNLQSPFYKGAPLALNDSGFAGLFFSAHEKQVMPTAFQIQQKWLDPTQISNDVDMDANSVISINEFQVAMHFWAPLIWSQSGPTVASDILSTLSGFYFDLASWEIWLDQSKKTADGSTLYYSNGNVLGQKKPWLLNLRAASDVEKSESFNAQDLDFSGKVSLHEHYFQLWGDTDGSGYMDYPEFLTSLYYDSLRLNSTGVRAVFDVHDQNSDARISLTERKFRVADVNLTGMINATQWKLVDFPAAEFGNHDTNGDGVIDRTELTQYESYFVCSANLAHDTTFWNSDNCLMNILSFAVDPVAGVSNPYRDANKAVWSAVVTYLKWSKIPDPLDVASLPSTISNIISNRDSSISAKSYLNQTLALVSTSSPTLDSSYVCSQPLTQQDGYQILVLTNPPTISLEGLFPQLIISASFLEFVCVMFFTVLCTGHIFYFAERHFNEDMFSRVYVAGILDGLYYSMVTVLTIGYGDKVAKTGVGQTFGIIWMFIGVIVFSIFSGDIASKIRAKRAEGRVQIYTDLKGITVAELDPTLVGPSIAKQYAFKSKSYSSMDLAAQALQNNDVTAIVAPRQELINFLNVFQKNGNCLNTFTLAGDVFYSSSFNRVCAYQGVGYLSTYLINNINAAVSALSADGTISRLAGSNLEPSADPTILNCDVSEGYPATLFIILAAVIVFIAVAGVTVEQLYKRRLDREINEKVNVLVQSIKSTHDNRIRRYAMHWLKKTRATRTRRYATETLSHIKSVLSRAAEISNGAAVTPQTLREISFGYNLNSDPREIEEIERERPFPFLSVSRKAGDPMLPIVLEMNAGITSMAQLLNFIGGNVHTLQKTALLNRRSLASLVGYFAVFNFITFLLLLVATIILIVTWEK